MISFMIITGSLTSQDMIRIHKQSRHDFPSKHICDGYCMDDIVSCEFMCGGQNSTVKKCKASIRICLLNVKFLDC